jgi:hypothetical protein
MYQDVDFKEYNSKFCKDYEIAMENALKQVKDFCVQIATAYTIIHLEENDLIPRIKAVVYSPTSDTFYIHINDLKFTKYIIPRLKQFFLLPQFDFETFNITFDCVDDDNFYIEVNINDESTILNNSFFKLQTTSI